VYRYFIYCALLAFQSKAKHHAVSAKLNTTFDFTASSFVVQWVEVSYLSYWFIFRLHARVCFRCSELFSM